MILQRFRGQMMVVRQADHSRQAGDFARHWGNETIAPLTPRDDVMNAATIHDSGWDDMDAHPLLDPETGWPREFRGLSPHYQTPMYRRSVEQATELGAYAGLLVSLHLSGLYNDRFGTAPLPRSWDADERAVAESFLAEQKSVQLSLATHALGRPMSVDITSEDELWRNYRLLQVWDRLSILYAFRLAAGGEIGPLPLPDGSETTLRCLPCGELSLALDPYPFDESPCAFPLPARLVPDQRHETIESYLEAFDNAPVTILECKARRV
ncbi:MAG TPA: DUF3891 family protein [Chloroflexota bacterium]|jgi:hypothetical protein|nr:DUF3891 family protein [Chloroflexota bacterium]